MRKSIVAMVGFFLLFLSSGADGGTVFKEGKNRAFYLDSASSLAKTIYPTREIVDSAVFFFAKKGESCETSREGLERILKDLSAKKVFEENGESFDNVYYYSPKISSFVLINGAKVNLSVSFSGEKIFVATPMNFGSY